MPLEHSQSGDSGSVETSPLTEAELEKFYFLSYRFSQGDSFHQALFFEWAQRRGFLGGLTPEVSTQIETRMFPKLQAYLISSEPSGHAALTAQMIKDQMEIMAGYIQGLQDATSLIPHTTMADEVLQIKAMSPDVLFKNIMARFLNSDFKYFLQSEGRPERRVTQTPQAAKDLHTDPYFSFVVSYCLRRTPTGSPAFDQLFQEIQPFFQTLLALPAKNSLHNLIDRYNQSHPDSPFEIGLSDLPK